ncbi:hypothetical protein, partial [Rhizobium phaseoli]|uniref:hypothetical protein n=1 Tax=Rhizobium phaseoli TaxID=396 RepID=UPI001AEE9A13
DLPGRRLRPRRRSVRRPAGIAEGAVKHAAQNCTAALRGHMHKSKDLKRDKRIGKIATRFKALDAFLSHLRMTGKLSFICCRAIFRPAVMLK